MWVVEDEISVIQEREGDVLRIQLRSINTVVITIILGFTVIILFSLRSFLDFPFPNSSILAQEALFVSLLTQSESEPFRDLFGAYEKWDSRVRCARFREKYKNGSRRVLLSLQNVAGGIPCRLLRMKHVSVLVKGWTWIPDNMDNLYSYGCGLTCFWTKSSVLANKPDVLLFETGTPSIQVHV